MGSGTVLHSGDLKRRQKFPPEGVHILVVGRGGGLETTRQKIREGNLQNRKIIPSTYTPRLQLHIAQLTWRMTWRLAKISSAAEDTEKKPHWEGQEGQVRSQMLGRWEEQYMYRCLPWGGKGSNPTSGTPAPALGICSGKMGHTHHPPPPSP